MNKDVRNVVMSVVLLVIFLALLPTVITSTAAAAATTGIDTATTAIVNLLPLAATVGGIGIALAIGYSGVQGLRDR